MICTGKRYRRGQGKYHARSFTRPCGHEVELELIMHASAQKLNCRNRPTTPGLEARTTKVLPSRPLLQARGLGRSRPDLPSRLGGWRRGRAVAFVTFAR